jgi:hypothetical protein
MSGVVQSSGHRWVHLMKQQSSITVEHLPTRKKRMFSVFLFAANKRKFAVSIFD